jgi:hypothetical protein
MARVPGTEAYELAVKLLDAIDKAQAVEQLTPLDE